MLQFCGKNIQLWLAASFSAKCGMTLAAFSTLSTTTGVDGCFHYRSCMIKEVPLLKIYSLRNTPTLASAQVGEAAQLAS